MSKYAYSTLNELEAHILVIDAESVSVKEVHHKFGQLAFVVQQKLGIDEAETPDRESGGASE